MMTSNTRGGFYSGRAALPTRNRAFTAPHGRVYSGPQGVRHQKFAGSTDADTGAHHVDLADTEAATITFNEDGSLVIEVQNKPANGNNGNGNGAAEQGEPVEAAHRAAARQVNRMSWEKNPADGSVTFRPDDDEVLHVTGDSTHAPSSSSRSCRRRWGRHRGLEPCGGGLGHGYPPPPCRSAET
jgi:hypothetical protein